jgi:hypothetical protein
MNTETFKNVGRNEPCPCGSGKKFKKCHGENQAWQGNTAPEATEADSANADGGASSEGEAAQAMMGGFDPAKMDLNWLAEFSSAIQRLPKGQLQQLQSLMQKAMSGKDVNRELEELQRKLPSNVQTLLSQSPQLDAQLEDASQGESAGPSAPLTDEQRQKLQEIQKNNAKSGFSRLWSKFTNK